MRKILNRSFYILRAVPLLGALLSTHWTKGNSGYHSLFLKNDGSLHAMGSNAWGEFGIGSTSSSAQTSPVQIQPSGVTQFASGHRHVVIVKSDGSAYAMGQNISGALGNANYVDQTSPAQIFPSGVKSVAAGAFFTLLLKNDGSLHATGSNTNGQLGTGDTSNRNSPLQIISSGVTGIAGGTNHSLILKSDGSVFATGQNNYGQLGTGNTNNFSAPTQIFSSGVIQVATGAEHSLFLNTDGSLWATGRNQNGQLGTGDTVDRNSPTQIVSSGVIQVVTGSEHSVFLKSDGSLHVMGSNMYGQLGTGDNLDRNSSVQILSSGVVQIAAGARHTVFLKADGSLWTFGWNSNGQLGVGDTANRTAPTMVLPSGVTRLSEVPQDFNLPPTQLKIHVPNSFVIANGGGGVSHYGTGNQSGTSAWLRLDDPDESLVSSDPRIYSSNGLNFFKRIAREPIYSTSTHYLTGDKVYKHGFVYQIKPGKDLPNDSGNGNGHNWDKTVTGVGQDVWYGSQHWKLLIDLSTTRIGNGTGNASFTAAVDAGHHGVNLATNATTSNNKAVKAGDIVKAQDGEYYRAIQDRTSSTAVEWNTYSTDHSSGLAAVAAGADSVKWSNNLPISIYNNGRMFAIKAGFTATEHAGAVDSTIYNAGNGWGAANKLVVGNRSHVTAKVNYYLPKTSGWNNVGTHTGIADVTGYGNGKVVKAGTDFFEAQIDFSAVAGITSNLKYTQGTEVKNAGATAYYEAGSNWAGVLDKTTGADPFGRTTVQYVQIGGASGDFFKPKQAFNGTNFPTYDNTQYYQGTGALEVKSGSNYFIRTANSKVADLNNNASTTITGAQLSTAIGAPTTFFVNTGTVYTRTATLVGIAAHNAGSAYDVSAGNIYVSGGTNQVYQADSNFKGSFTNSSTLAQNEILKDGGGNWYQINDLSSYGNWDGTNQPYNQNDIVQDVTNSSRYYKKTSAGILNANAGNSAPNADTVNWTLASPSDLASDVNSNATTLGSGLWSDVTSTFTDLSNTTGWTSATATTADAGWTDINSKVKNPSVGGLDYWTNETATLANPATGGNWWTDVSTKVGTPETGSNPYWTYKTTDINNLGVVDGTGGDFAEDYWEKKDLSAPGAGGGDNTYWEEQGFIKSTNSATAGNHDVNYWQRVLPNMKRFDGTATQLTTIDYSIWANAGSVNAVIGDAFYGNHDGAEHPTGSTFTFAAWNAGTNYAGGEYVEKGGKVYLATGTSATNNDPATSSNNGKWTLVADSVAEARKHVYVDTDYWDQVDIGSNLELSLYWERDPAAGVAPLAIAENQPIGATVGEFNATDPDANAILTYSLVSGPGDGNNSLFTLDQNGTLKTATTFDFESNASSYSIRVQVEDEHNGSTQKSFTISLTDDLADNPPKTIFVKASASGINDGTSWTNAYQELQNALTAANAGDEIRVTAGTYKPTSDGNRSLSFTLKNGVIVLGSFAGIDGNNDRNWTTYPTILSGDIGVQADNSDNSYHVVQAVDCNASTILDGFTIREGRAYGPSAEDKKGGGIYALRGAPVLRNLKLLSNEAEQGAGIYLNDSDATFTDSRLQGNTAIRGGGMVTRGTSTTTLSELIFVENEASQFGGGIDGKRITADKLKFSRNKSPKGGAISVEDSYLHLKHCLFRDNNASSQGGALRVYNSNFSVSNSLFYGNQANNGGAFYFDRLGTPTLEHLTIVNNHANMGSAIFSGREQGVYKLKNSIVWGNISAGRTLRAEDPADFNVTHTILQGSGGSLAWTESNATDGGNNLDVDPQFLSAGSPLGADGYYGTTDDGLQLSSTSPAINVGSPTSTLFDALDGNRTVGNAPDLGAYESQSLLAANTAPTDLNSTAPLAFAENQPIGTVVGEFNATDPDLVGVPQKTFVMIVQNGSWAQAKSLAATADAADPFHRIYLATIGSEQEHNQTKNFPLSKGLNGAWLGGNDAAVEGEWRWTEGPEGEEDNGAGRLFWNNGPVAGNFSKWESPNPNNGAANANEHYLLIRYTQEWNDATGGHLPAYVIEKDRIHDLIYSLVPGAGDIHNSLFTLETNGTLKTATTFDFESNASSYSIRVQAKDEFNGTVESSFTVNLTDLFEDADGDGFSDQEEASAGTLTNDPSSKPGMNFGLLGYWPLDGNTSDLSGNDRNGTAHNGAAFQIGAVGQGLYFDGSNDSFTVPSFELGGEMSIAFWGKVDQFQDWDTFMDLANGSNSKNLKIQMNNSGSTVREMIFQMKTSDGDRYVGEPFWVLNEWVHLVLTVDSAGTMRLYRSGKLIATESGSGLPEKTTRSKHWFGKSAHSANYFKGKLDEIRIYGRALLADEAMQLAQAGNSTPTDLNASGPLTFPENSTVGTVVGEFNATDPDAWSSITYSLVPGFTHNVLFTMDSNGTLKTAATFDYESNASSYSIRVQVKDEFNASIEGNFTVTLNDLDDRPAIVTNGQFTKVSGTEAIVRPAVGQVGGGLITVAPHGPSKGVGLTLFWGHADGGTNPASWANQVPLGNHFGKASQPGFQAYGHMEVFSDSAEHLLALTPDGSAITLGDPSNPTANGMYFNHISDYRNAGIGITNSRFTALFVSTLTPQTTGNHKFRLNSADDQAWVWLDLDQDGNLSSMGAGGDEKLIRANQEFGPTDVSTPDIPLVAGQQYKFALISSNYGGGGKFRPWVQTPGGSMEVINPSAPSQAGLFSVVELSNGQPLSSQSLLEANVSGLVPGASYFYRVRATNSFGDYWAGSASSFVAAHPLEFNATHDPLAFSENQPIGSIVGGFNGTDTNTTLTYVFSEGFQKKVFELNGTYLTGEIVEANGSLWRVKTSLAPNGVFDSNSIFTYGMAARVSDGNGSFFESAIDFSSISAWDRYRSYALNELVSYNGNLYLSNAGSGNSARTPGVHPYWTLQDIGLAGNYWTSIDSKTQLGGEFWEAYISPYDNHLFTLDANGTLRTATTFDYESNATSYIIRVQVRDEHNASLDRNFTVSLSDLYEAPPNATPTDLNSTAPLTIAENQPIGTFVGQFTANDPDANASLSYRLANGPGSQHNNRFSLDANGTLRTAKVFDYENRTTFKIRVQVADEHNVSIQEAFIVSVTDLAESNVTTPDGNGTQVLPGDSNATNPDTNATQPGTPAGDLFQPIVETGEAKKVQKDSATLRGSLVDNGGARITGRGFLLSERPNPKLRRQNVTRLDSNTSKNFQAQATELKAGKKYYYRAFATNTQGTALGSVESFTTLAVPPSPSWINAQPGAAANWWTNRWFGNFYLNTNGWIRHEKLGWVFPMESPTAGLWLWKRDLGWLWTDKEIYPFLYRNAQGGWLYFYGQRKGTLLFYDYEAKRWISKEDRQ